MSLKYLASITLDQILAKYSNNIFLRDATGLILRYGEVLQLAQSKTFQAARGRLVMCGINNNIDGIAGYLALLVSNAVPIMVSPNLSSSALDALIMAYRPDFLWLPQRNVGSYMNTAKYDIKGDYAFVALNNGTDVPALHGDLALLISTSGSTGSKKYVRLSHQNIWSNAAAIVDYLKLTADEISITTLPPSYSYGLSIIHSHLWIGAGLAVCDKTFFDRDFWNFLSEVRVTSLAGVPYHYEILKKLRFTRMELPNLRTLTQAGGRMSEDLTIEFATHCHSKGMRFFTMYGQTEASPRIAYVPAEQAIHKAGTIGIPIPGGQIELQSEKGVVLNDAHVVGEIIYRGPNVCLGYAECRADLSLGDTNFGILQTGDLAERDEDGYYRLVGRKKRFLKLYGNRVNLQDLELNLSSVGADIACTGSDDMLEIYLAKSSAALAHEIKQAAINSLRVGVQSVAVYEVDTLPRNESGKLRYADLKPENARRLV